MRRIERSIPLYLLGVILMMNFLPRPRVNNEQALPGFFDRNRVLARKMVTVEFFLTSLAILLGFRGQDSCNFRIEGIPVKE